MDGLLQFPFKRNLSVDPLVIPVGMTPTPVAVPGGGLALQRASVTTFKVGNPCPFWVWYRGWTGDAFDMPAIAGMGHHLAPGAIDINTSHYPDWLAAVASDELGAPIYAADGSPLFSDADMAKARLVMTWGSGA